MMILTESNFSNIITEASEDKKKLYLKGIFMESEQRNRNNRIYKRAEIERAVNKINEAARAGRHVLGALDHPPTLEIRLDTVSHRIVEMTMDGNNAIGKAEILPTPAGNIARSLIEAGVNLGVSTRGSGSVNESSGIVEGFECVTVDIVAQPSAINAYPSSILEHLDIYRNQNRLMDLATVVTHDASAQKYLKKEINKFIEELFKK
jgi:hypothetical protein